MIQIHDRYHASSYRYFSKARLLRVEHAKSIPLYYFSSNANSF